VGWQDDSKGAEVRELMSKAFKGPLTPQQQQQVGSTTAWPVSGGRVENVDGAVAVLSVWGDRCCRSWRTTPGWSTSAA
jgi:hypothetical protein